MARVEIEVNFEMDAPADSALRRERCEESAVARPESELHLCVLATEPGDERVTVSAVYRGDVRDRAGCEKAQGDVVGRLGTIDEDELAIALCEAAAGPKVYPDEPLEPRKDPPDRSDPNYAQRRMDWILQEASRQCPPKPLSEASKLLRSLRDAAGPEQRKTWRLRLPLPTSPTPPAGTAVKARLKEALFELEPDAKQFDARCTLDVDHGEMSLTLREQRDAEIGAVVEALYTILEGLRDPSQHVAPARPSQVWARPWVLGPVAIALATVGLSLLPLSTPSIFALACTTVGIAIAVVVYGYLQGASGVTTLLSMTPLLVMVAFAVAYAALGDQHACGAGGTDGSTNAVLSPYQAHLYDPLILSLQATVAGGFGDLKVCGSPRTVVYLEMLLLWGVVATAAVQIARRFTRLDDALDELRPPREG